MTNSAKLIKAVSFSKGHINLLTVHPFR